MNISTKQLAGFVYAAQLGSFTRAAERLHVTQAGLSAIVRELESQMGCRLFDRTTRAVSLTEGGGRLLPVAQRVLEDLAATASELDLISTDARQTLRVGATPMVACKLLPSVCEAFKRSHPTVTVRLLELQRDRIQELVRDGEIDLGLGIFLKTAAGIERRPLFSSALMCVSPASKRMGQMPDTVGTMRWSELREAKFVGLQPDNPVQQVIERHLRSHVKASEERYSVNHIETQIAMVEIGTGWAVVPSFALPACSYYKVRAAVLKNPVVRLDFHQIVKKGRGRPAALDPFVATLTQMLTPRPGH